MTKEFTFEKVAHIGDTNVYGNVYFSKYFDWQGEVREEYIRKGLTPQELKALNDSGIRLVTREASVTFNSEIWLYDEIIITMKTRNIKKLSVDLIFTYVNKRTNQILAFGRQKIIFKRITDGKLIPIPQPLLKLAYEILDENIPKD